MIEIYPYMELDGESAKKSGFAKKEANTFFLKQKTKTSFSA